MISACIRAKRINEITSSGHYHIDIDVEELDISKSVSTDEIVKEYDKSELLESIGIDDVVEWLKNQGFAISEE
ncbi:hypothetical protein B7L51_019290 [Pectobacterium brasiliense]|uniref:hypothetical protein n=1 Tax=Pectobacterium brasiliense TaxID=180957 RepID=UPI000B963C22|nr:hypothetical protein [Pectobacterium carotovorum]OYN49426.1 hypothetical protein B7L51_19335 [Pectobacterium carotovorum]